MKSLHKLALTLISLAFSNFGALSAGIRRQDKGVKYEFFGRDCKFENISGDFGRILAKEAEERRGVDNLSNFKISVNGSKVIFIVSCNFEGVIFGEGSEDFLSKVVFVNSNFKDVATLAGANIVSIGGSITGSNIKGGLILSEEERIKTILLGSDNIDKNSKGAHMINDIFKRLGYSPPIMERSVIDIFEMGYMAQMLRGVFLNEVNIKRWEINSHIGGVPIYGCSGSLDLQKTKFLGYIGAKGVGVAKEIAHYQQYISTELLDELSKNKEMVYVVANAKEGDYIKMSYEDKEIFIKIFNLIFRRLNIEAIDEERFNNAQPPYGYINLSRTLGEGYLGSISKIEALPKSSIIELRMADRHVIVHELLHWLGGLHPWRGENICLSALSNAKTRGAIELNSPGPLDYEFIFALMKLAGRGVKEVHEHINKYIDNSSIDVNIYLPGNRGDKNCSKATYSTLSIGDVDLKLLSQDRVQILCGSKKNSSYGAKPYLLTDKEKKIYISLNDETCWDLKIFDKNKDTKLFKIPIGGISARYCDIDCLNSILTPLAVISALLISGKLLYRRGVSMAIAQSPESTISPLGSRQVSLESAMRAVI